MESKVSEAKLTYNEALKNLEQISEEIHRQRQQQKNLMNFDTIATTTAQDAMSCETTTATAQMQNYNHFPCVIDSTDEYLEMPEKLSTNSSPVRQRRRDEHDCPHLLQDFEAVLTFPERRIPKSASTSASDSLIAQAQLHGPYELKPNIAGVANSCDASSSGANDPDDIEQWTEIRLSHSESTSSSYSNQSLLNDDGSINPAADDTRSHSSSSSSDEPRRKVTCTTIFQEDQINKKQGLSQWLSRSNSFKASGRRQSLDLLIDAGDKVKDVFSFGFQRVGKTLERRNSESEMNNENDGAAAATNGSTITTAATAAAAATTTTTTSPSDFFLFSRSVGVAGGNGNGTETASLNKNSRALQKKTGLGLLGTLQNRFTKLL